MNIITMHGPVNVNDTAEFCCIFFCTFLFQDSQSISERQRMNESLAPWALNLNFYVSRRFCFVYKVGGPPSISDLRANSNHIKVQSGFVVLWGSAINETSRDNTSCGLRQVPPTQFSGSPFYAAGNWRDALLFPFNVLGLYYAPKKN